jgi:hypothetical protein
MKKTATAFSLFLILAACQRNPASSYKLSVRAPSQGTLSAIPAGRKACFGVSVSGPGISTAPADSCSPSTGILAGYVEAGKDIQVSVPKGEDRVVDLYLYLEASGANDPCPGMTAAFAANALTQTYKIGSVSNVSLSGSDATVEIEASFPASDTMNITQQLSMPATCLGGTVASTQPTPFGISSGQQSLTGTDGSGNVLVMKAKLGRAVEAKAPAATGIQLIVR